MSWDVGALRAVRFIDIKRPGSTLIGDSVNVDTTHHMASQSGWESITPRHRLHLGPPLS